MDMQVSAGAIVAGLEMVRLVEASAAHEAHAIRKLADSCRGDLVDIGTDLNTCADMLADAGRRCTALAGVLHDLMIIVSDYEEVDFSFATGSSGADGSARGSASFAAYKGVLRAHLAKAPAPIRSLYRQCAGEIHIASTNERDGCYSPEDDCIRYDWQDDCVNPLGEGNTYFHETGHQIDFALGRRSGATTPISYQAGMNAAVYRDYQDNLARIQRDYSCDEQTAQGILRKELYAAGASANVVSDMFGSLTGTMVSNGWGHDKDYWQDDWADVKRASEAFAGMTADRACGAVDHVACTSHYLPRATAVYESILERWGHDAAN